MEELQRRRDRERRARSQTEQKKAPTFFSTFFGTSTVPAGRTPYESYSSKPTGALGSIVQFLFYISSISLIGFLILVMLHYTMFPVFSFLPGSSGIIPIPVPTNRQQVFIDSIAPADVSANFVNVLPFQYTISFDAIIKSDFVIQTAPRILLYNSLYPLIMKSTDTIDTIIQPITTASATTATSAATIAAARAKTAADVAASKGWGDVAKAEAEAAEAAEIAANAVSSVGLTSTNIIVYLDSQINDLHVRVITGTTTYIESPPIKNIPLQTPFRITIMLSSVLLEVYLNGFLEQSVPLKNTPPVTTTKSVFFGPPVLIQQAASVMNISYWNTMLPSASIRMYGAEPFQYIFSSISA